MSKSEIAIVNAKDAARLFEWGELVGGFKVYACHDAQLDVLASSAKFTFGFAGTGGGKTCIIPLWLLKQIQKKPDGRFLVVSPTLPIFESSELKRHILQTFQGTAIEGSWNQGSKVYRLATGGEIVVKTVGDGGDYQRLVGGQYDAVAADEVFFLSSEVWNELRRRGGAGDCPILCVTTPNANNWIYEAKQEAENGNADYFIRHWGSASNPTYSKEHLEREKAAMSAAAYARMYEGEFSAFEGLVYECWGVEEDPAFPVLKVTGNPLNALPSPPVRFFGDVDWGFNPDPACIHMIAECEDGISYVCDEIYGTGITPDVLAVKAQELIDKWAIRVDNKYAELLSGGRFIGFYADTSRPECLTMFRKAGIPIRNKRVDDILAGIAYVDSWFRAGRLKVFSTCTNTIREHRTYQWDSDRKGFTKGKPLGRNDHSCDALRYGISSQKYGQKVMPVAAPLKTNEQLDAEDEEKLKRFGLLSDPSKLKELEDAKEKEAFYQMAFGDLIAEQFGGGD